MVKIIQTVCSYICVGKQISHKTVNQIKIGLLDHCTLLRAIFRSLVLVGNYSQRAK